MTDDNDDGREFELKSVPSQVVSTTIRQHNSPAAHCLANLIDQFEIHRRAHEDELRQFISAGDAYDCAFNPPERRSATASVESSAGPATPLTGESFPSVSSSHARGLANTPSSDSLAVPFQYGPERQEAARLRLESSGTRLADRLKILHSDLVQLSLAENDWRSTVRGIPSQQAARTIFRERYNEAVNAVATNDKVVNRVLEVVNPQLQLLADGPPRSRCRVSR